MQHDAQEFLRCFLCYFQDAEKEVQKFYSQFPHSFSPKINPIMQRFLASSKTSQETKDKIVRIVNEISESNDKMHTDCMSETDKVKINLFPKAEIKTEAAKSPQKVQKVPSEGDTAGVVDEMNEKVAHIGASTEPPTPNIAPLEEAIHDGLKGETKLPLSSKITENTESELTDVIGKQQRAKGLARKGRRMKPYDKQEKVPRSKKDKNEKIIRQRRDKKSKEEVTCDLNEQGRSCDTETEQKSSTITLQQSENKNSCTENSIPVISKSDTAVDCKKKAEESRSYQDVFSQFLASLPEDDTDSVEMQSDSDNEDIVLKKMKEKRLRNSPRRSPRKTSSEMVRTTPRKFEISKLALSTKSESSVMTVKHKLDFSDSGSDKRKETVSNISASVPTSVTQTNVKSEIAEEGNDTYKSLHVLNSDSEVKIEPNVQALSVPVALVPVVKLENCDYILNENGTSVSAAYAAKCLTPVKNGRRCSTGSGNYLKQRNQPFSMDITDEEQFKKALAEMLNSPVKSRSKYDLIERTFQVIITS